MKLSESAFRQQIARFVSYRGIDIVLLLKNGKQIQLEKNRQMRGDLIFNEDRRSQTTSPAVHIDEIDRVELYAQ